MLRFEGSCNEYIPRYHQFTWRIRSESIRIDAHEQYEWYVFVAAETDMIASLIYR